METSLYTEKYVQTHTTRMQQTQNPPELWTRPNTNK